MCEHFFLFVLCQNVMYYCTARSAVFDWICALQVFIIIIKILAREEKATTTTTTTINVRRAD